jgi:hypothetical protein
LKNALSICPQSIPFGRSALADRVWEISRHISETQRVAGKISALEAIFQPEILPTFNNLANSVHHNDLAIFGLLRFKLFDLGGDRFHFP